MVVLNTCKFNIVRMKLRLIELFGVLVQQSLIKPIHLYFNVVLMQADYM